MGLRQVNMNSQKPDTEDDAKLNSLLNSWQVPVPSPWLEKRATQAIISAIADKQRNSWPLSPLRLAAATATAAIFGIVLGLAIPATDAANAAIDSDTIIEMMW